jgi:glutamyl-tRNA(Gln) amidotransferase subunit E
LIKSGKDKFVKEEAGKHKSLKPTFIAETVCTSASAVKKQFNADINPRDDDFKLLFEELDKEKIAKESVLEILKENKPVKDVISKYELMPDEELEKEIKKIIDENKGASFNVVMGKAMGKLRGKASGKKVAEMLKKLAK